MVYRLAGQLLDGLFPVRCRLCDGPTGCRRALCDACHADLPWLLDACPRCALPLADSRASVCGRCQRRPPAFACCTALLHYARPVDYLVRQLKFSGELGISRLFADLFAEHLGTTSTPLPELLVPVPLHVSRLRERGFNQSLEIGRHLHPALGIDWQPRLCRRLRATQPQSLLDRRARRHNLKDAFGVEEALTGEHVAVIDDVMTSGHTGNELALALKRAGAGRIDLWVVARAGTGAPVQLRTR